MTDTRIHPTTTRTQRGLALYRERGAEIERTTAGTYRVPSCTGEGFYLAHLDLQSCTCPDHPRAKASGSACKHRIAAEIVAAKARARRQERSRARLLALKHGLI